MCFFQGALGAGVTVLGIHLSIRFQPGGYFLGKILLKKESVDKNQEFCQGGHGGGGNCSRNIFVFKTVK